MNAMNALDAAAHPTKDGRHVEQPAARKGDHYDDTHRPPKNPRKIHLANSIPNLEHGPAETTTYAGPLASTPIRAFDAATQEGENGN